MVGQAQVSTTNKRLCGVWTWTLEKLWMEGNGGLENGVENVLCAVRPSCPNMASSLAILTTRLRYLVLPANLGIQYAPRQMLLHNQSLT